MNEPVWTGSGDRGRRSPAREGDRPQSANLADILERVLDKGIVIAGDIRVDLLDIELLTIKIRLVVASVDRAREMGIDWWEHDPSLSSGRRDVLAENRRLRRRIGDLEAERAGDYDPDGAEALTEDRPVALEHGREDGGEGVYEDGEEDVYEDDGGDVREDGGDVYEDGEGDVYEDGGGDVQEDGGEGVHEDTRGDGGGYARQARGPGRRGQAHGAPDRGGRRKRSRRGKQGGEDERA